MNTNLTEGHIIKLQGKIKEKWGDLTNDELLKTEGRLEHLIGLIKEKYGENQEQIKTKLKEIGVIS